MEIYQEPENLQISRNYKLFKLAFRIALPIPIYKLVEIISYSNPFGVEPNAPIYKLVEIISYSNSITVVHFPYLQISRNYKLFKLQTRLGYCRRTRSTN